MKSTYTYAILPVSSKTFEEIKALLVEAGYNDALKDSHSEFGELIDMHGIALSYINTSKEN